MFAQRLLACVRCPCCLNSGCCCCLVKAVRPLPWCSLERVDPSLGYTAHNVVLIASEFQTRSQWSGCKLLSLNALRSSVFASSHAAGGAEVWSHLIFKCRTLLASAKQAAHRRYQRGREAAGTSELVRDDLIRLYFAQRGCCAYSGIPMSLLPESNWMISLERLNNQLGYIPTNIGLICIEFQTSDSSRITVASMVTGSPQWSLEKFAQFNSWLQ